MQLSNTSKYAIRILSYIAKNEDKKLQNAKELSEILEIPYKFLTKIMTDLVKKEFILSIRGREGGYKLARSASSISVLDILNAFNELTHYSECILGSQTCNPQKKCILHDQWAKPRAMIKQMFSETTLEKIEGEDFKT